MTDNNIYVILKSFIKDRNLLYKYYFHIKDLALEKEIKEILNIIFKYYETYTEHEYLSSDELKAYFHSKYPQLKNPEVYDTIFNRLSTIDTSDSLAVDLVKQLIEVDYGNKMLVKIAPLLQGETANVMPSIAELLQDYHHATDLAGEDDSPFFDIDLDDLLEHHVLGGGLHWRLPCLQDDIGSLRGGTLGHVFARPNYGKTAMLLSEISHWATQLEDEQTIIHFNNEEPKQRVKTRTWSAVTGLTMQEILADREAARELFIANGGNKIHLYDSAHISVYDIEEMVKKFNARAIVIDQSDKVYFRGGSSMSTPDRLKETYVRLREIAKAYEIDIVTAGQASAEATGKQWLIQDFCDNSKTGKPGEMDWMVGVSKLDDTHTRYISICKNKLKDGEEGKHVCIIEPHISRYKG